MTTLGERLKALREGKSMTPFDLAVETRIPEQNIRLWEQGRKVSNPDWLASLAMALGTTTDFLITGKQPEQAAV